MQRFVIGALIALFLVGVADARRGRRGRRRTRAPGHLLLKSTTTGAEVFINNTKVGEVPLDEPIRLAPGEYTVKITKRGYTQYLDVFRVDPGKTTTLDVDLLPVAGILVVTSEEPEARVYIDDKFVGTTPLEVEVLIGQRKIRVKKAGFYDLKLTRQAIAGERLKVRARLKPLPVGTTPYRPAPPPPPKWYEKWWVWATVAGGAAAVALTVTLSVTIANQDEIAEFGAQYNWKASGLRF
jgi:hypothetical protein